jgi:hypothetical protein
MNQTSSKEPQHQDKTTLEESPVLEEGTRPAPARTDHGPGPCADGHAGHQPSDTAALTSDNGGGTSGNHGNGTAG